jgi:hypothetical protein
MGTLKLTINRLISMATENIHTQYKTVYIE